MDTTRRRRHDDAAARSSASAAPEAEAPVAKMRTWGPTDILSAPVNRETVQKLFKFMIAVAICPPGTFVFVRDLQEPGRKYRDAISAVAAILVLNMLVAAYVISAFSEPDPGGERQHVERVGIWKERREE